MLLLVPAAMPATIMTIMIIAVIISLHALHPDLAV